MSTATLASVSTLLVYSPLPAEPLDPWAVHEGERERERHARPPLRSFGRETYPPLPWTVGELTGTLWRNIHTGRLLRLSATEEELLAQDCLVNLRHADPSWPDGFERWSDVPVWLRASLGLGFWWDGRYILEHDVRVDRLPAEAQLRWCAFQLAHEREQVRQVEDQIARMKADGPDKVSCYAANLNMRKRDLKREQVQVQQATAALHAFAARHSLPITPELLNAGLTRSTSLITKSPAERPVQLALFA